MVIIGGLSAVKNDNLQNFFSITKIVKLFRTITKNNVQSNLCTTAILGTQKLLSLLTGGLCSEVPLCYKQGNQNHKIVVAVDKWALFGGGR